MNARARSAAIVAAVVALDRVTKIYIRSRFTSWDVHPIISGFFNIVHTENPGAAFGVLADSTSQWRSLLLVGVSLAVMAIIGTLLWQPAGMRYGASAPGEKGASTSLIQTGLALVFGGALGNVWDRIARGTVTDFLQFYFGSYEFPSFNVADSAITIGAVLLLLDLWRTRRDK